MEDNIRRGSRRSSLLLRSRSEGFNVGRYVIDLIAGGMLTQVELGEEEFSSCNLQGVLGSLDGEFKSLAHAT